MAGTRSKIARAAREAVQRRIVAWINGQSGTQQAICESLQMRASQLHTLVNEGAERCSLEYLLDVWERCGGTYTLVLSPEVSESTLQLNHQESHSAVGARRSAAGGRTRS
ncbi:MAG TPA: hypothetical protein VFB37_08920 [Steroidobacteraceae bacterium]|nr:hypothetical protein [Steroidobacteraceae bacterium]